MNDMKIFKIEEETPSLINENDFDEALAVSLHQRYGDRISVDFPNPLNDHRYILRSKGWVGQVPISEDIMIHILPKVPIANLFRMLEYAYKLKPFDFLEGVTHIEALSELFEHLASILAKNVLDRVRKGLYRSYVEREDALPYLRGRVLFMPSLRSSARGALQLQCEYEEHTADLIENRILARTLFLLPKLGLKRGDVQRRVRQAFRAICGIVGVTPIEPHEYRALLYHRLNEDYRPMHALCRFFLEHCGPGIQAGEHDFIPFLVNMPALFESFVAGWLRANLEDIRVIEQYHASLDPTGSFSFRIDLVLEDPASGKILAVMDTKYKREDAPGEADLQQVVAYAARMNTKNAFLIYPSAATRPVDLQAGRISVRSLIFDIGVDPDEAGRVLLERLKEVLACDS